MTAIINMVFNKKSITTFNNMVFTEKTMAAMPELHHTMKRLYVAAQDLRDVSGQSAIARLLGVSPQVIKNWESRGISIEGALTAQKIIGCDANWLLSGEPEAIVYTNTTWTPTQRRASALVTDLPPAQYRDESWPFPTINKAEIARLSENERGQIEGFIKALLLSSMPPLKSNGSTG